MRAHSQAGITLIEVIVGISIITISVVAIGFSVMSYVDARAVLLQEMKSAYLAEETYEILRAIRDDNWNTIDTLALDTYHYLAISTSTVAVSATPEIIDGEFRRSFVLRDLYRNSDDDIVASTTPGATIDPDARLIELYVASPNGTTSLEAILTNLYAI